MVARWARSSGRSGARRCASSCRWWTGAGITGPHSRIPARGAGSLLMLLACRHAARRGARRVVLYSVSGAQDFYRRMGLHHPAAQLFEGPPEPAERSRGGRLDRVWLSELEANFNSGRLHGWLESDMGSVIASVERHVDAYWAVPRTSRCWPSCAIA